MNVNFDYDNYDRAKQAAEAARAKANESKATSEEKEGVKNEADNSLKTAENNVTEKQTKLDEADGLLATKQAAVDNANSALTSATSNLDSLTRAYTNLNSQEEPNESELRNLEQKIETAQQQVQNAKDALELAEKERDEALKQKEAAQNELEVANNEEAIAQETYNTAEAEYQSSVAQAETDEAEALKLEEELAQLEVQKQEAEEAAAAEEAKAAEEVGLMEEVPQLSEEEAVAQGYTIIKTVEDLQNIMNNPSGKYIIMNDIDLAGVEWTPLTAVDDYGSKVPFSGILNGNGYAVQNLTINVDEGKDTGSVGFFEALDGATVENLVFDNAEVNIPESYNKGTAGILAGTATGVNINNIALDGNVSGHQKIGGLLGTLNPDSSRDSKISNINADVNVNGSYYAGGLVGTVGSAALNYAKITFSNCNVDGNISVNKKAAGGIIGESGANAIVTIVNSTCSADLTAVDGAQRIGGMVGNVNGSFFTAAGCTYTGTRNAEGDFQGDIYGYYQNDARVSIYEIPAGLPADDILMIDGVDGLEPVFNAEANKYEYQITVSTMTGLDAVVSMIMNKPELADYIVFNVNFDFEAMDAQYDPSVYAQYGIVQTLTQDPETGEITNHVYIDNEIDTETEFHNVGFGHCDNPRPVPHTLLEQTMIEGLYKDDDGYFVIDNNGENTYVNLKFNYDNQKTEIEKRLDENQVKYREYITMLAHTYQQQIHERILAAYGLTLEDAEKINLYIDEPEYEYLKECIANGEDVSDEDRLRCSMWEADTRLAEIVEEATKNEGCGMGGNASFLEETTGVPALDENGLIRYTTVGGTELRQKFDDQGNAVLDEDGNTTYVNLDGSDYVGFEEVYEILEYPQLDGEGNFLYTDEEGNTVKRSNDPDENGNYTYTNEDGTPWDGNPGNLTQQQEEYDPSTEAGDFINELDKLLNEY